MNKTSGPACTSHDIRRLWQAWQDHKLASRAAAATPEVAWHVDRRDATAMALDATFREVLAIWDSR